MPGSKFKLSSINISMGNTLMPTDFRDYTLWATALIFGCHVIPAKSEFLPTPSAPIPFLLGRIGVKGPNIGMTGSGKGLHLWIINGCISHTATALTRARLILPGLPFNLDKISAIDSAVYNVNEALEDSLDPAYQENHIPLEKASAHFHFILGEDNRLWKSSVYADMAVKHLTEHVKPP
ncbi:hypothetical protein HPG69_013226 [Diceros bicornis minor]|uniref:BAAT/Acyl-CoA thioester hydrolase C-terminal domain-containing protein n=1 Tax=Diceros bicornis minor TaxID=77932 RepID=A0A7J7F4F4_DICBM|nr:hypothetical protein HPG69_013226 [Diceros bicornis minor]